MIIKIERYYNYPEIKRQTPNCSMQWKEFIFTEEDVDECDYLVILDYPKKDIVVKVSPNNILSLCLEPPNEVSKYRQYANKKAAIIYNQLDIKKNNVLSHGALPWHIDKDYDFLSKLSVADLEKEDKIVWVTSNQKSSKGHRERMLFLEQLKELPFVDMYGRGIKPISDKWQALNGAKYAIAYENFNNHYYWTEKIADCYLSYTMPIYYGCNKIADYFPKNSFIQLDPQDKHIDLFLKEIVKSNQWQENLEAIIQARDLVLNQYQLFPFLYEIISELETNKKEIKPLLKKNMSIKGQDAYFDNYPLSVKFEKEWCKLKIKVINRAKSFLMT